MKKVLMIVCIAIAASGGSYSQSTMTPEGKKEVVARYQGYMEELNLTEEQKPKVKEINKIYFEGLLKLKNSNGSKMENFRTFRDLSSTRDKEMKKVLTKEQYTIYKENQEEQRDNFKEHRRRNYH